MSQAAQAVVSWGGLTTTHQTTPHFAFTHQGVDQKILSLGARFSSPLPALFSVNDTSLVLVKHGYNVSRYKSLNKMCHTNLGIFLELFTHERAFTNLLHLISWKG